MPPDRLRRLPTPRDPIRMTAHLEDYHAQPRALLDALDPRELRDLHRRLHRRPPDRPHRHRPGAP